MKVKADACPRLCHLQAINFSSTFFPCSSSPLHSFLLPFLIGPGALHPVPPALFSFLSALQPLPRPPILRIYGAPSKSFCTCVPSARNGFPLSLYLILNLDIASQTSLPLGNLPGPWVRSLLPLMCSGGSKSLSFRPQCTACNYLLITPGMSVGLCLLYWNGRPKRAGPILVTALATEPSPGSGMQMPLSQ